MKKITLAIACFLALGTGSVAFAHGGFGPGKHFEKQDTNGDGKVTKAEHARAAEERFTLMDENKDGVLTVEELMQGRGPRGEHGRGHGPGQCDHEHAGKAAQGNAPKAKSAAPTQGAAGSAGH